MLDRTKTKKSARLEEFEQLASAHLDLLYNTALRVTGDVHEAERLVEDTFAEAYRLFDHLEKGTNHKTWLLSIMRTNYINGWRKWPRKPLTPSVERFDERVAGEVAVSDLSFSESGLTADLDELVEDDIKLALESLPPEFRLAVILSDISGLSYREISEVMGTSTGTVRSELSRARDLLQRRLYHLSVRKRVQG